MTIKEIEFENHKVGGFKSKTNIKDDIDISIVCGEFFYCSPKSNLSSPLEYNSYEIAIFKNGEFTREFYDQHHDDDVVGYISAEEITSLINKIKKS
tara:strand:- start:8710 stop:8997 length:288 start_codon:yes stop_codon:yes gene_type:complete